MNGLGASLRQVPVLTGVLPQLGSPSLISDVTDYVPILTLQVSREVVGRLMADPAFMQKLVLEQMITAATSLVYEAKVRGDHFTKELDLVAINTLSLMGGEPGTGTTAGLVC
jgi:hypothetical protein